MPAMINGLPAAGLGAGVTLPIRTEIAVIGLAMLLAVLTSLMIGAGIWIPVIAFFGITVAAATNITFLFKPPITRVYLHLVITVTFIATIAEHLLQVPIGYVEEAMFVCLALPLLRVLTQTAKQDSVFRFALTAYGTFLLIAVVSSIFGRSRFLAAGWQFFYDMKWLFMLAMGLLLMWDERTKNAVRLLIQWAWIFILPLVILQALAPTIYANVAGYDPFIANPFTGFLPGRLRGPFSHAGYLALYSAFLAAGCLILLQRQALHRFAIPLLIYIGLMVLAGERQELANWIVVAFIILCFRSSVVKRLFPFVAALGLVVLVALNAYMSFVPFDDIIAEWNLFGRSSHLSERGALTLHGVEVANSYFPLGSGLGTYAGPGAQKFDQSLFVELGFLKYWWFRLGRFLVDVYWPNFFAEGGWIGALGVLVCNLTLGLRLWLITLQSSGNDRAIYLLGLSAFALMFMNTLTSQIIMDPRGAFVMWIVIGVSLGEALRSPIRPSPLPSSKNTLKT